MFVSAHLLPLIIQCCISPYSVKEASAGTLQEWHLVANIAGAVPHSLVSNPSIRFLSPPWRQSQLSSLDRLPEVKDQITKSTHSPTSFLKCIRSSKYCSLRNVQFYLQLIALYSSLHSSLYSLLLIELNQMLLCHVEGILSRNLWVL